jgi:hypothetical protein
MMSPLDLDGPSAYSTLCLLDWARCTKVGRELGGRWLRGSMKEYGGWEDGVAAVHRCMSASGM